MRFIIGTQRLVYGTALCLAILSALLLVLRWAFGWENAHVMYRLASSNTPTLLNGILFALFFVFCCLYLNRIFARQLHVPFSNKLADRAIISLFLAYICGNGYYYVDLYETDGLQPIHIQSASLNGQVFHLQFRASAFDAYSQYYELYQCDRFDVLCNRVYIVKERDIIPAVDTIELEPDSDTNVLSVIINGEVAFSTE